jgi:hypothetical protein
VTATPYRTRCGTSAHPDADDFPDPYPDTVRDPSHRSTVLLIDGSSVGEDADRLQARACCSLREREPARSYARRVSVRPENRRGAIRDSRAGRSTPTTSGTAYPDTWIRRARQRCSFSTNASAAREPIVRRRTLAFAVRRDVARRPASAWSTWSQPVGGPSASPSGGVRPRLRPPLPSGSRVGVSLSGCAPL